MLDTQNQRPAKHGLRFSNDPLKRHHHPHFPAPDSGIIFITTQGCIVCFCRVQRCHCAMTTKTASAGHMLLRQGGNNTRVDT